MWYVCEIHGCASVALNSNFESWGGVLRDKSLTRERLRDLKGLRLYNGRIAFCTLLIFQFDTNELGPLPALAWGKLIGLRLYLQYEELLMIVVKEFLK